MAIIPMHQPAIKDRERAVQANPFNATKLKLEKAAEKSKGKSNAVWALSYEVSGDVAEGSAASLATQPLPKRRFEVRSVRLFVVQVLNCNVRWMRSRQRWMRRWSCQRRIASMRSGKRICSGPRTRPY
jgi:hypothetical protein